MDILNGIIKIIKFIKFLSILMKLYIIIQRTALTMAIESENIEIVDLCYRNQTSILI